MCAGKCMFGDKSTFGSCQNGQNMPKKGQQEKIIFCTFNRGQLPVFFNEKSFTINNSFLNLKVF